MTESIQSMQDPENPQPVAFVDREPDFKSLNPGKTNKEESGPFPIWTAADFAAYEQKSRKLTGINFAAATTLTIQLTATAIA